MGWVANWIAKVSSNPQFHDGVPEIRFRPDARPVNVLAS